MVLFVEAACETLLVRLVTTIWNFRRYASYLGRSRVETGIDEPDPQERIRIMQIKTAISRCRHLPWARKCLVDSIAAKRMMDRRRIPSTIYLGVAKNNHRLVAHAWIRSGNIWVSGGRERGRYTVVGFFS